MRFNFENNGFIETDKDGKKLAIAGSDKDITWEELKQETEKLEQLFSEIKLPEGEPIIIYGHKECLFPIAILTCIKNNIPYVPIDKIMPMGRIEHIKNIIDAKVIIICGDENPMPEIPIIIDKKMKISRTGHIQFKSHSEQFDPVRYIMFTSGSTGAPKGVQITRESILSFVKWTERDFMYNSDSVFMNQAPFSFDISLIETFGTFYFGASMVLNDSTITKNPINFIERLKKYKCNLWNSTPAFAFIYLTEPSFNGNTLPYLRKFLFMGEELPARTVKKLKEVFENCKVYNAYGPTEATVVTTLIEINENILNSEKSIPIGYPKNDGEILIINNEDNPLQSGEIVIVGDHVSVGYYKNIELSDEKFFMHKNMRAYRTGDYGYYKNGIIFFEGRKDDQIKLHGYRIEIGEITSKICEVEGINEAVTIPLKSGNQVKRIIAFVLLKNENGIGSEMKIKIIDHLKKTLPEYMIPGEICFVNEFPLNPNHKIDKNKLIEWYSNQ